MTPSAVAQYDGPPPSPSADSQQSADTVRFAFKGATFEQVIDFYSRSSGLPIIWDAEAPDGTLHFISDDAYTIDEALTVLNRVLASRGIILRVIDGMLHVQRLDALQREDVPTFVGQLPADVPPQEIVTIVRPLLAAMAKPLAERLADMVATYGSITALEQQNTIIVTETASHARRLLAIIDELDRADPDGLVEIFTLKHTRADALMQPLRALMSRKVEKYVINEKGQQIKIEEESMPGLSLAADARTNAIVAKGNANDIGRLRELVALLDVPSDSDDRQMRSFALEQLDPTTAAARLEQLFAQHAVHERPIILSVPDQRQVTVVGSPQTVEEAAALLRELDTGLVDDADAKPYEIVSLEHLEADRAINLLRSLIGERAARLSMVAGADQRSVVLTGTATELATARVLLHVLDMPSSMPRQVRLIRLSGDDPADLMQRARSLYDRQFDPDDRSMAIGLELDPIEPVVTMVGSQAAVDSFTGVVRMLEENATVACEFARLPVEHVSPSAIVAELQRLLPVMSAAQSDSHKQQPVIAAMDELDEIAVAADAGQMQMIRSLVASLDREPDQTMPAVRIVQLQKASAGALADIVNRQYQQRPQRERARQPVHVTADQAANALLIVAAPELVQEIEKLVADVDGNLRNGSMTREIRTVRLQHAAAAAVQPIIQEMLAPDGPTSQWANAASPPMIVRADAATNSLIINATTQRMPDVEALIAQLDRPQHELSDIDIRTYRIRHADVGAVERAVRELVARVDGSNSSNGIFTEPNSRSLIVSARSDLFPHIEQLLQQLDATPTMPATTLRTYTMRHALPSQVAAAIREVLLHRLREQFKDQPQVHVESQLQLTPNDPSGSLIVSAPNDLLPLTEELIAHLDALPSAEGDGSMQVRTLQFADAAEISEAINAAVASGAIPDTPRSSPRATPTAASNAVVLTGSEQAIARMEKLIESLDVQGEPDPAAVRTYVLRYNRASDIAPLLERLLQSEQIPVWLRYDAMRRNAQLPDTGPEVRVQADERTNAVVVFAPQSMLTLADELIQQLDVQRSADALADDRAIHVIAIQQADASSVATSIDRLFANEQAAALRPVVQVDRASNTLIVRASPQQFASIESVVRDIDEASLAGSQTIRRMSIDPTKASAEQVAEMLQRLLQPTSGPTVRVMSLDELRESIDADAEIQSESAPPPKSSCAPMRLQQWLAMTAIAATPQERKTEESSAVTLAVDPETNSLVIVGPSGSMERIAQLVQQIQDQLPAQASTIRCIELPEATQAAELARLIVQTLREFTPAAGARGELSRRCAVIADSVSNTLIVAANDYDFETIRTLIVSLVSAAPTDTHVTRVLPVEFADARGLSQSLRLFLTERARASKGPPSTATIVASPAGGAIVVSADEQEFASIEALLAQLDQPNAGGDRRIEVFVLEQGESEELARIIREQFESRGGTGVRITADSRSNTLVVNAPAQQFPQIAALIERLDTPAARDETIIRTYTLEASRAKDIVATLTQTLQLDARGRTDGVVVKPDDDSPAVQVRASVVADARSNTLLVTATADSLPIIEKLIRQLDAVPTVNPIEYRIVPLKHAIASDVSFTLRRFAGTAAGDGPQPRIDYDRLGNQLIVAATADQFEQMQKLIAQLDVPSDSKRLTEFVPLKFAEAEKVREALSMFYGPFAIEADTPAKANVSIVADPASNSLVISADESQWDDIRALLAKLDNEEYDASLQLRVIPLLHADAPSVANAINAAFQGQLERDNMVQRQRQNLRSDEWDQDGDRAVFSPTVLVESEQWVRASAEPLTNSVIITASKANLAKIERIVSELDVADYAQLPPARIIRVAQSDAQQLAEALQELHRPAGGGAARADVLRIVGDNATGTIIVRADDALFERIRALAETIQQDAASHGMRVHVIRLSQARAETVAAAVLPAFEERAKRDRQTISIRADAASNSLIVAAPEALFAEIQSTVQLLDGQEQMTEATVRIVRLQKASAQSLAPIITNMLNPGVEAEAGTAPGARAGALALQEQIRRLSLQGDGLNDEQLTLDLTQPIQVTPDPNLNALVISSTDANVRALERVIRMFDDLPITDAVAVQLFPLQNIAAPEFARIVRELFDQGKGLGRVPGGEIDGVPRGTAGRALLDDIAISVDERTNTVIVAGKEESVALVEVLTQRLDSDIRTGWVEPRVIHLQYADAQDLADVIQQVLVEGERDLPQAGPLQQQIARLQIGSGEDAAVSDVFQPMSRLIVRAEPQLNAIILVGTPANLEAVARLIAMLDVEAAGADALVRIYPIEHATASRLAPIITQLFDEQVQTGAIRAEDRVVVQADERTNALIVATTPRSFETVDRLLQTLDSETDLAAGDIRRVELERASASRAAALLQELLDARMERLRTLHPQAAALARTTVIADAQTNSLLIVSDEESFGVVSRMAAELDAVDDDDRAIVEVVPVGEGNADRISETIEQVMQRKYADVPADMRAAQMPLVLTDARSNSLLVAAAPEDIDAVREIVARLDAIPGDPTHDLHVLPLPPNTRAEQIAPRVQRLMQERLQSLGDAVRPSDQVSVEAEPSTNSLIVSASGENFALVQNLVEMLAQSENGSGGGGDSVAVLQLTSSRASDVVLQIRRLFVDEVNRARGANTVRVSADDRLNAVLVSAPPTDLETIRQLVQQLDGAQPSAVVEIKYIPLTSANALEMVNLIENVLSGRGIGTRQASQQATVLQYLRRIAQDQTGGAVREDATTMEVSAAIRQSITLTPDVRTNTVIVSAPSASLTMIEQMIRDLDQSSTNARDIRIFRLENADAVAMAEILADLFNLRQGQNVLVLKPREQIEGVIDPTTGLESAPVEGGSAFLGSDLTAIPDERQQLFITVDSRTNSLLVSATDRYLDLVEQVVKELDKQEANEREVFVYQLRNSSANEVAAVIGEFVEREQEKLISTLSVDQIGSATRLLEREVTIQGDEKSNTVLVSASPRFMEQVKELIRQLDVDPPQVLIQVLLAEVTLDTEDDWGVDFAARGEADGVSISGGFGLASAFVTGLGLPNITIASDDFDLLIRALQAQGRLQVLSNPSIMTANNEPARIQVGETIRVPVATSISDAGRLASTVEPEDIGVILNVTPSINPDGFVRLDINPEISDLSSQTTEISEDFQSPIITRRTADTTVTVYDGQTVVIGGLISDRYERRDRKVPFFGDLPVVGALFRSESVDTRKTELLIVLTPHVIQSPAEIGRMQELTDLEIDRLTVPPDVKHNIREGVINGTGGVYDAQGNPMNIEIYESTPTEQREP